MAEKKDKAADAPKAKDKAAETTSTTSPQAHAKREAQKQSRWNLDTCQKFAKRFDSVEAWAAGAPASYKAAVARGLIAACTAHMTGKSTMKTGKAPTNVRSVAAKPAAKKTSTKLPKSA